MELRHLEYFVAVADTLSFTKAAKRLHVVQSGVSATVRALERELGSELFSRQPQSVTLTPAGLALLPRAREALNAARAAKDAVDEIRGIVTGTVSVGTLVSIDVGLPAVLAALRARHPAVAVRLRTAFSGSAGLARALRDGQLDAAFLSLPVPPAGLSTRLLASAPLDLYVPSSHPLAGAGRVALARLAEFPFIDSPPGFGNRVIVDDAFAAAGVEREVTLEVADIGTAQSFIRQGLGIGFLIRFLIGDPEGLAAVQIADHELLWRLFIATPATRPPSAAAQAFLSVLGEMAPSPTAIA
jgi:DNA-binding transcriptional LysR family regulator